MLEAKWKTLKASNLKKLVRRGNKNSRKSTRRRRYRRKQRGGGVDTVPFGNSEGVPRGLGGTVTDMDEEGVPRTKSIPLST